MRIQSIAVSSDLPHFLAAYLLLEFCGVVLREAI
jgi:hypothetical protein